MRIGDTPPSLATLLRDFGRIGCLGFGGPPAHVAMLRELVVDRRAWIGGDDFEHGLAATNVLPGPGSTQLAIWCAWRVRGLPGALAGGAAFILPGLLVILALAALFLGDPPAWVRGVGAGAGAVVAAIALHAGIGLLPSSWERTPARARWIGYLVAGGAAAALLGPWLIVVLLACGGVELGWQRGGRASSPRDLRLHAWPPLLLAAAAVAASGGLLALCWMAFKVGALSYGGGFVTIPLMQGDAVDRHHWMTDAEFLNAVALGQATPGPVTHTVAVVGYAAHGLGGALLASLVAFLPSFSFVLLGGARFERLRTLPSARAFLDGAGPAAIGAILGSAIPLAAGLSEWWQIALLAAGVVLLLVLRRGVVLTLLTAGALGALLALAGGPLPS
ncbi:chromate efflux transporter [Conexibacter sp. JD483]|uniref:chromate efflux transporter n=1 Tax=unclassified Conexibacter TaxID=2627773 RepID=UPI002718E8C5|nr:MULTISPECIES: chromate efflux transporter [unclassified Conexibacter]MDO8185228.1 chromate efflux transporter [Conexibacter sp. CPCC 205706]MDO8198274.1 chromate efflux transporter [Conexibacter sp. CPCC 205762]MDR9367764.1 chromate efflux transporter [Conexibacter sp. JD483]